MMFARFWQNFTNLHIFVIFDLMLYIRGSNSAIFIFVSLLNGDQHLKERICSFWSKFFPLKVDSILEELNHPEKQTGRYKSCPPFQKWWEARQCTHMLLGNYCSKVDWYTANFHVKICVKETLPLRLPLLSQYL